MHKVFDTLYHHGKMRSPALAGVYNHAHKHHKKYLWGAAGFFGLFKLFAFLIVSLFSYASIISADLTSTISVVIPATTIDIQDGQDIIQFNLSEVDIGTYQNIQNMSLTLSIDSDQSSLNLETLRNNTSTSIENTGNTQIIGLKFQKIGDHLRALETGYIPSIIDQLLLGNTIAYFMLQEEIYIGSESIVIELDVINTPSPTTGDLLPTTGDLLPITGDLLPTTGDLLPTTGDLLPTTGDLLPTTGDLLPATGDLLPATGDLLPATGDLLPITGDLLPITGDLLPATGIIDCSQYDKKKDCEDSETCIWDKKSKVCNIQETIYIQETYQMDISDPTQIPTPSEIKIESRSTKQKINGYLKIAKNTKIYADNPGKMIYLEAPSLVTDDALQGKKGKNGISDFFEHKQTVQVGDPTTHITLEEGQMFEISIQITESYTAPGTLLHIFTSQDGENRENLQTTCTVDENYMCTFETPHLTLFAVGNITWNNMEFVNNDFRAQNPTDDQIISAFFGTTGNRSAYTSHWNAGCRPTGVSYYEGNGCNSLAPNYVVIIDTDRTFNCQLNLSSCSAVVGRGDITITKNFSGSVFGTNLGAFTGLIIDNFQLDGNGNTGAGLRFSGVFDLTINDVQAYNNSGNYNYGNLLTRIHNGIFINNSKQTLINNSQTFSNTNEGIFLQGGSQHIINNVQSYNNGVDGIYIGSQTNYTTINNSQFYRNYEGMYIHWGSGIKLNNVQIYHNVWGIYFDYNSDIWFNNVQSFKNQSQFNIYDTDVTYYGKNTAYPNPNLTNMTAGSANPGGLGWTAGTMSTTDPGYTCDLVTQPINGDWVSLYGATCSEIGFSGSRARTPIVKYQYGNNMTATGSNSILRQVRPVAYLGSTPTIALSDIPYHGHRFVGEYYNPGKDINIPVSFRTGTTPPQGTNVISGPYSSSFSILSYIYEPNLSVVNVGDPMFPPYTWYNVYDSNLIFMTNFDSVAEIGEGSIVKDLSSYKHFATINGATYTASGKYGGAYSFDGVNDNINVLVSPIYSGNTFTFMAWVKSNTAGSYSRILGWNGYRFDVAINGGKIAFYDGGWTVVTSGYIQSNWHHIAVTLTTTDRKVYLDGNLIYTEGGSTRATNNGPLYIGSDYVGASYFSGIIDEVRLYNRELNADEINLAYRSNLSAKSDHREYTANITGVGSWGYGKHTYDINIGDTDNNRAGIAGNVMKYLDCNRSTIWRNNNNFLTGGFWTHSPAPGYCDIVAALYGTGTAGADMTAYTSNREGWTGAYEETCNYQNINIVYLTGGTNKLPSNLINNTIYVLSPGTYIQTEGVYMSRCNALIGTTGNVYISGNVASYANGASIIDNIKINGLGNDICLGLQTNYNTIHNFEAYNCTYNGIYLYGMTKSKIHSGVIHDIPGDAGTDGNGINAQAYNSNNIISDIDIYNTDYGLYIQGNNNFVFTGIQSFNNTTGAKLNYCMSTITNSKFFNNVGAGIEIGGIYYGVLLNNMQVFNNNYGIYFNSDDDKYYVAINNSQIYNNNYDGVYIQKSDHTVLNNCQIYNNTGNGVYFGASNTSGLINHTRSYNNGLYGFYSQAGSHTFYGVLTAFGNTIPGLGGSITAGGTEYQATLGWTGGTTNSTPTMSWDYITNPKNASTASFLVSFAGYTWTGIQGRRPYANIGPLYYSYGSGITTQIQPVYYDTTATALALSTGMFTTANFIGSDIPKITGDLLGALLYPSRGAITVTATTNYTSLITKYAVYGNITTNRENVPINTSTGITVDTSGGGTKRIVTALYDSRSTYFGMHFQKIPTGDFTAPTLYADYSSTTWINYIPNITLSVSDTNLSIAKYRWDNGDCRHGTNFTNGAVIQPSANYAHVLYLCALDLAGNSTTRNGWVYVDMINPSYVGSSYVSGANYINGSDYRVKGGTTFVMDVSHSDNNLVWRQYFGFNQNGCGPNACGGAPWEIKSFVSVSDGFADRMVDDTYIDITGATCSDGDSNCADNDATWRRSSSIKGTAADWDYYMYTFMYDIISNGVGYTPLTKRLRIDNTIPTTSITSPTASSRQSGSFNVSFTDYDARSGLSGCYYRILDDGSQSLGWTSRTCNSSASINITSYCTTQGIDKCTIQSYTTDKVGNISATDSRNFSIDTIAPAAPTFLLNTTGYSNGTIYVIPLYDITDNTVNIFQNGNFDPSSGGWSYSDGGDGSITQTLISSPRGTGIRIVRDSSCNRGYRPLVYYGTFNNPYYQSGTTYEFNYRYRTIVGSGKPFAIGWRINEGGWLNSLPYTDTALANGRTYANHSYTFLADEANATTPQNSQSCSTTVEMDEIVLTARTMEYKVGGGSWALFTGQAIPVTSSGTIVYARYRDLAGNLSDTGTITINNIDTTTPVIVFTGVNPADNLRTTGTTFTGQNQITELNLGTFTRGWNGTTYPIYDSGLVLMMNFDKVSALSETDGMIRDFSHYGNNGSGYGGVTRTNNGQRNGAYDFNGSSRIVITENQSLAITGQLSYGARFKADTLASRAGIMSKMRVRGNGYNLQVGTTQNIACGMGIYVKTSRVPQTGVRYHAICVYSGTTMKLYVNGQYQSQGNATLNVGPDPLTLGVFYTANSLYFDGLIDEPRVRNRALTSGEIYQMRRSNLTKYNTDKWFFTTTLTGLANGSYRYTGYAADLAGFSATTGRTINIDTTAPTGTIIINSHATYTSNANTTLTLSGTDVNGVTQMKFSCNNITYSAAEAYNTTKAWNITNGSGCSAGEGTKAVYVKFMDGLGNRSAGTNDYIILDTTPPTFTFSNGSVAETNPLTLRVASASDTGSYLDSQPYNFSRNGSTRYGRRSSSGYLFETQNEPTSLSLRVRVKDNAGNEATKLATGIRTNIAPTDNAVDNSANEGSTILFTSDASDPGGTTFKYQWYSNSTCTTAIGGQTGSKYTAPAQNDPIRIVYSYVAIDAQGLTGNCATATATRNNVAPTASAVSATGYECTNVNITGNATDVGGPAILNTGYVWYTNNTCTTWVYTGQVYGTTQNSVTGINYYYKAFDLQLSGSLCTTGTILWTNIAPTASNFTYGTNIDNSEKTANRLTGSSATEGSCGNGALTYSGIVTQGNKGVCSGAGITGITYTPNAGQVGSDTCTVQIKDNENSTVNFTITRNGIDTDAPTGAPTCTPVGYRFSGSTSTISCSPGTGGTVVRYTTNGTTPTAASPTWSNQSFSATTTLKAISCDALNNCNTSLVETEVYTLDNTPPVSSINPTNSNRVNTNITFTLTGSDAGIGGTVTEYYKILSGGINQACTAGGYTTYSSAVTISIATGAIFTGTVCYYGNDSLGNTETYKSQNYQIDKSDPTVAAPAFYAGTYNGQYFNGTVSLQSSLNDIGAGISGSSCQRNVYIGGSRGGRVSTTQVGTTYCQYNSYTPNANFSLKFLVKDLATNTGYSVQNDFIYDNTAPTVGNPVIYSGNYTGSFYKGTISVQSTVSDAGGGINTSTCEYSLNNGSSRSAGTYAGGYCRGDNITPNVNIIILIRVKDNLGTTGTSNSASYSYDATAPITTNNSSTARTGKDVTITLTPSDGTGAGVLSTTYCVALSGSTCTPSLIGTSVLVTGTAGQLTQKFIRYYSTDKLTTNETVKSSSVIKIDKQNTNIQNISPASGTQFTIATVPLVWSGNDGTGAGISGYRYEVTGTNYSASGFTTNTGITLNGLSNNTYYRHVYAVDNVGNTGSRSASWNFNVFLEVSCLGSWNNDNFIDTSFRSSSPTTGNIICALYGSGLGDKTAYTQFRSGRNGTQCSGIQMNVVYTGKLNLTTLASNTIYVMTSSYFTGNASIAMADCSVIVSNYSTGTRLTSTGVYGMNGMIHMGSQYMILDGLHIDGSGGLENSRGISAHGQNGTINNCETYNNRFGISTRASKYIYINNSKIYNNRNDGLWGENARRMYINNSHIFNNHSVGISLHSTASENSINNTQIYNNGSVGLYVSYSTKNSINNCQIYNNQNNGIEIINASGNIINNSNIYNNNRYGIKLDATSTGNKYYGTITMFNNTNNNIGGTPANFTTGSSDDYPGFGRNTGSLIKTGIMSRDYITNPINTNGNYMLPWAGSWTGIIGEQISYFTTTTEKYSYGSGIVTQIQPVYYSGTTLKTGGSFDTSKYIGSNITKRTGSLLGLPSISLTTGPWTLTGIANATYISKYSLFGNLSAYKIGQNINTSTGMYLATPDGTKRVITQLYSGTEFATHFENDTILDTTIDCMTGRDNDNFISGAFRDMNPSDQNIICALYGSGIGDTTAYTQSRSGRNTTQCSGVQMIVTGLTAGTDNIPVTLSANTIYVLSGGTYTTTAQRNMENCSTIIGKGAVTITGNFATSARLLYSSKAYGILDNLNLIRNYTGSSSEVITFYNTNSTTINNINASNGYRGIYIYGNANNNTISNSRVYNNIGYGISLYNGANNNIVNNSQSYNNNGYGIYISTNTNNNIINNTQSYNNGYGIYIGTNTNNNIINNTQSYNNASVGIYIRTGSFNIINNSQVYSNNNRGIYIIYNSTGNIISNSKIYNNSDYGIQLDASSTGNRYYGTNYLFNNVGNLGGTTANLTTGYASDYPGIFTTGSLITTGVMSRNYLTNPINTDGNYMLPWTGIRTGMRGWQTGYSGTVTNTYSYGSGILTQIQPVYYSGTTLKTGGSFDATKYIGSDVKKVSGSITGVYTYSPASFIVTGTSSDPLVTKYSIFGDITTFRIGANINTQSTGITLTTGLSTNKIVTQLYDPTNYFATHFQNDTLYNIPTITGIQIFQTIGHISGLNITYFAPYQLEATLSGNILTGAVDLIGINGNGGSCIDYYASGSCAAGGGSTSFSYPLVKSGSSNIRLKTGVYPDQLYPEIFFAPNSISRYNTGVKSRITANNYTLIHMINPYTMTGSTSFWIELSASSGANPNVVDLQVYLIKSGTNISFFNGSDWRTNPGVQLVGAVTKTTAYSHTHTQGTVNKSDYLISLSTNSNGTIGTKNIDINGDFRIALYADTNSTTRGRDLKYYSGTVCENTSGRYRGNVGAGRTTTRQSGCPDTHIHVARQSTYFDGIKAIVYASYTGGTEVLQTSGTQNFYFATGILPPNATSFITPTSGTYTGNVYISRYPATDANGGTLTYNISLTNSGQTAFITGLANNTTATGFTWNSATVADGTYSITGTICDSTALCTPFYLNDPFTIQNSPPMIYFTGSTPASGATITGNNFKPQIEMITTGGMNNFIYTFSGINYSYYDSGLVLMMNFDKVSALSETDGMIRDFSHYGNNGSGYGGVTWTGNGKWNGGYIFDGVNDYINAGTGDSLNFGTGAFTVLIRAQTNTSGQVRGIIDKGGRFANDTGWSISYAGSPTNLYIVLGTGGSVMEYKTPLTTWQGYKLIGFTRESDGKIYFINDGNKTNTPFTFLGNMDNDKPLRIGVSSHSNVSFSGRLDEPRLRNRALSSGEIYQMRRSNLAKYNTDKWLFTDDRQCMSNGTYTYTGYVSNMLGFNASTGRTTTVSIPNYVAYAPEGYFIGSTGVSSSQTILSGQFTGDFKMEDRKGTTGWYTTIQLPNYMSGTTYQNNVIGGNKIKFMATGTTLIEGTNTSSIYINPALTSGFTGFSAPVQYLKRDYAAESYYCPAGVYGNKPYISVDIPAYQNPDTYSGMITIDINN